MTKLSYNWSFETAPLEERVCPCCDEPFHATRGIVRDEKGADVAAYMAVLPPSGEPREVFLFLLVKDKTSVKHRDRVVSLALRMNGGDVAMSLVDGTNNPFGSEMTREEVLASPLKSLIFVIADFVSENDPHIRPSLEGEANQT
jgi:hypothetical protein